MSKVITRVPSARSQLGHRFGLYESDGQTLFVPLEWMWLAHKAAARFNQRETASLRECAAEIERQIGRRLPAWIRSAKDQGRNLGGSMRKREWFLPWLLRGKREPKDVSIVAPGDLDRARSAWGYVAHCRDCRPGGIDITMYAYWLRSIKSLGWLKWLYGDPPPAHCYVVPRTILRLRLQTGANAVHTATTCDGMDRTNLLALLGKSATAALFDDVLANPTEYAEGRGSRLQASGDKARTYIRRLGKAATIGACLGRAGVSQGNYSNAGRDAKALGLEAEFRSFLFAKRERGAWQKAGLLAPRFFVPTETMYDFRDAAKHARRGWVLRHPAFDNWFLDWTVRNSSIRERLSLSDLEPAAAPPVGVDGPTNGSVATAPAGAPTTPPAAPSATETDGPIPPDAFRLRGETYTGFPPMQHRLLAFIWNNPRSEIATVMNHIYGDDQDARDNTLTTLLKKLRTTLDSKHVALSISQKSGYYILENDAK